MPWMRERGEPQVSARCGCSRGCAVLLQAGLQHMPKDVFMVILHSSYLMDVRASYNSGYAELEVRPSRSSTCTWYQPSPPARLLLERKSHVKRARDHPPACVSARRRRGGCTPASSCASPSSAGCSSTRSARPAAPRRPTAAWTSSLTWNSSETTGECVVGGLQHLLRHRHALCCAPIPSCIKCFFTCVLMRRTWPDQAPPAHQHRRAGWRSRCTAGR